MYSYGVASLYTQCEKIKERGAARRQTEAGVCVLVGVNIMNINNDAVGATLTLDITSMCAGDRR